MAKAPLTLIQGGTTDTAACDPEAAREKARESGFDAPEIEHGDFIDHLFRRYRQSLSRYLLGILKSSQDTEEVIQETYIRVIQSDNLDRLESRARAYIFKIATNLVWDRMRQARVRGENTSIPIHESNLIDPSAAPDFIVEWQQDLETVKQCLHELQPRCRTAFLLFAHEELSMTEIAKLLRVSTKTIKRDLVMALELCKSRLERGR